MDDFWDAIDAELNALRYARTADDVFAVLGVGPVAGQDGRAVAFFSGGGGDVLPDQPLLEAGWVYVDRRAPYWWAMRAPNGDVLTYVEGDIYRGNELPPE